MFPSNRKKGRNQALTAIDIRPAQQADIPSIIAINTAGRPGVYPLTPEMVAAALASASYFMVAELHGQVAGYLIGYTAQDSCEGDEFAWFQSHLPRFLYIDQVAVAPASRRSGIGAHLYAQAAANAQTLGLPALVCEVNLDPPNPASVQFHTRLGFQEVGVLTVADGRTVSLRLKKFPMSGG
jgi:predicted GNAT superfamily acetyltransferase